MLEVNNPEMKQTFRVAVNFSDNDTPKEEAIVLLATVIGDSLRDRLRIILINVLNNNEMNIYDKIKRMGGPKSYDEKMYEILSGPAYSTYSWQKEEIGEGMTLLSQLILRHWRPRFLMDNETKCAYEFMNGYECMVTVTENDIDWDSLNGLGENAIFVAQCRSLHFPTFIYPFKNGVSEVSWQLNPDGKHYIDDDGFGIMDDKEVTVYGFIDKVGNVVAKFQTIKDVHECDNMRARAEKIVADRKRFSSI